MWIVSWPFLPHHGVHLGEWFFKILLSHEVWLRAKIGFRKAANYKLVAILGLLDIFLENVEGTERASQTKCICSIIARAERAWNRTDWRIPPNWKILMMYLCMYLCKDEQEIICMCTNHKILMKFRPRFQNMFGFKHLGYLEDGRDRMVLYY